MIYHCPICKYRFDLSSKDFVKNNKILYYCPCFENRSSNGYKYSYYYPLDKVLSLIDEHNYVYALYFKDNISIIYNKLNSGKSKRIKSILLPNQINSNIFNYL